MLKSEINAMIRDQSLQGPLYDKVKALVRDYGLELVTQSLGNCFLAFYQEGGHRHRKDFSLMGQALLGAVGGQLRRLTEEYDYIPGRD